MDFVKLTEQIIRTYLGNNDDDVMQLVDMLDENISVIGTGKQEIYRNVHEYAAAIKQELEERKLIQFQIENLSCTEQRITEDVVLVFGNLYIHGRGGREAAELVDICMDTRFSILYECANGVWKMAHFHLSVPNVEQLQNEAYPKTLIQQMEDVKELAEKDPLTGLLNYRSFQERYHSVDKVSAWLYIVDIDNFKQTNDVYGHLAGNLALKNLAEIMKSTVRDTDLVCRMGGDEFIILCSNLTEEEAESLAERLLEKATANGNNYIHGISIGISPVGTNLAFDTVMKKADKALYHSKRNGKNRFSVIV